MRRNFAVILIASVGACAPGDERPVTSQNQPQNVVEVVARGLTLDAPNEIPSGWTTFRFRNESPMIHFALVERVPQGYGIESHQAEIAPVFQKGLDLLGAGDTDGALAKFGELPAWFGEIVFLGGPGLTSPGQTSQATVFLEPGTYLLECYVKTNGVFHSYNPDPSVYGMVHEFQVTAERSDAAAPAATLQLDVSSLGGIQMKESPAPGEHTVAVHFADQTVHENFVGHDIHLVRLPDDVDLGVLEQWMDWTQTGGLQTPAPAEFLGGLNEMPAESTGYFTVSLDVGTYAWISEVPGSADKGMLQTFHVEARIEDQPVAMQNIEFLRTPDDRFEALPDYPFEPHYAQVAGNLRLHYVDEGPQDGAVVVLLHGEPSWSFLYRKMIPLLVESGYRVIAPDLIGFGKSDKPIDQADHSYERHVAWTGELLIDRLGLSDITLFAQDWGGLIGLRLVAENGGPFARVAISNTGLPTGDRPAGEAFLNWLETSQNIPEFPTGQILQGATARTLTPDEIAAYDAPFPDATYQAGARVMPALVPITPEDPAAAANRNAWNRLRMWDRPFITLFSDGDPITRGGYAAFQAEVPGAAGQPHMTITDAGHFLQEDKGEELARLLADFIRTTGG